MKWQPKNQRSGFTSSSARIRPLPYSPPVSEISLMRSNISIGGSGNCALPGPNSLAAAAGQQILVFVTAAPIQHRASLSQKSRWSVFERNGPVSQRKRASYHDWREYRRLRMALRQSALAFAEIA